MSRTITTIESLIFKHLRGNKEWHNRRVPLGDYTMRTTDRTGDYTYTLYDTPLAYIAVHAPFSLVLPTNIPEDVDTRLTRHRIKALSMLAERENMPVLFQPFEDFTDAIETRDPILASHPFPPPKNAVPRENEQSLYVGNA